MRDILLTSTAAVCLILTVPAANAQSDAKRHEETKKEQVQQPSGAEHQRQAQQQQHSRSTTGQASEERKDQSKRDSTKSEPRKEDKGDTAKGTAPDKKDQNAAGKSDAETNRHAQSENAKREKSKSAAGQEKDRPSKSTASESEKKSTTSEQNRNGAPSKPSTAEAPKSSAQQKQENASTPSANTNAKTAPADKAAAGKAESPNNAPTNSASQPNATTNKVNTADSKAGQIDPQKKVQLSETISRTHDLAPPVRNLGISITVGERVPSHIHLRPLPREIVTIAPEYRDYDYFTTEEEVVIVSPRTHEIVTEIPRDASRARAEFSSSSTAGSISSAASGAGSMPCQVMQRTASGDMQPMDPNRLRETTGSGSAQDHLAVKVQGPNGQEMPEITLPDKQGRIIAETNGSDCRIIVEPGQTGR